MHAVLVLALDRGVSLAAMRMSRLACVLGLAALLPVSGCGESGPDVAGSGYSHTAELLPHPGIAEGRPTVEVNGVTFYLCPPLGVCLETPLIADSCLTPGDAGASRYGNYSMLEPSVECPDGKQATDAGGLGWGFVGEPLIAQRESPPGSLQRAAVLDCLRATGRG